MKHIKLFEQFVNEKGSYMPPGDLQGWRKNPFAGYDLGMENQGYRRHIAKAIKHLPGIDKYSKMTEEYGGVAVDNMNKEIIIKQYGTEDNSKQLAKILAKIDPNLDVKSIKNNFNAKPSQRYQYDVKNDIWNYTIRKVKGFDDFKESVNEALPEGVIRVFRTKEMTDWVKDVTEDDIKTRDKDLKVRDSNGHYLVNRVVLKDGTKGWVWSKNETFEQFNNE